MSRLAVASPSKAERNGIAVLALALVWLTVAANAVVFTEPAPADVLALAMVVALPICGLVAWRRGMVVPLVALCLLGATGLVGATQAVHDYAGSQIDGGDFVRAVGHGTISIYLYATALVLTGFVALDPRRHTTLICDALLLGGLAAASAGIVGVLDLVPGVSEHFAKFGRASGTFKDPNVLGAFLVLPGMIAVDRTIHGRGIGRLLAAAIGLVVLCGIAYSFSRGALLMLAVALATYAALAFLTATSTRQRLVMTMGLGIALVGSAVMIGVALQAPGIARIAEERGQLLQSYDVGSEGRFGGQLRAVEVILDNPLGIGALQFSPTYHHENPHNVYLNLFLANGWLGGLTYLAVILGTLGYGAVACLRRSPHQRLTIAAYATFVGLAVVGLIVDTDHWRHFFIVLGVLWGLLAAPRVRAAARNPAVPRRSARIVSDRRRQPRILSRRDRNVARCRQPRIRTVARARRSMLRARRRRASVVGSRPRNRRGEAS